MEPQDDVFEQLLTSLQAIIQMSSSGKPDPKKVDERKVQLRKALDTYIKANLSEYFGEDGK